MTSALRTILTTNKTTVKTLPDFLLFNSPKKDALFRPLLFYPHQHALLATVVLVDASVLVSFGNLVANVFDLRNTPTRTSRVYSATAI